MSYFVRRVAGHEIDKGSDKGLQLVAKCGAHSHTSAEIERFGCGVYSQGWA